MKVAVVGGGWAGIAAAVELTRFGASVTLFEAGRVLGGRARSVRLGQQTLDNGQHLLLGAYRDTLDLMQQVGADPERLLARYPLQVIDNTGFHLKLPALPAPLHLAIGLLSARGVGLGEKLKTALWMQSVQRRSFQLDQETTVAKWLDGAGQTGRLRHHLWEPLCLAALNTSPEVASAQIFANVLRDSLGSSNARDTDLLLPRVSLGEVLPEPAGRWLEANGAILRLSHRIERIGDSASKIHVDGSDFDAAILATAPQHLNRLYPGAAEFDAYEPIATAYLQLAPETQLDFPLQNRIGGYSQWIVDRGHGLLACVLSGHGAWESLSDAALTEALLNELDQPRPPQWTQIIREKRATFSCRPQQHRVDHRTRHPRLFIAGDHTWADYPGTLEGAVRSGRRAAKAIFAK